MIHVLMDLNVSVEEELAVKWYEMRVLGLPSSSLASFFGPLNLAKKLIVNKKTSEIDKLRNELLPHVFMCCEGLEGKEYFMNIYFEKEFQTDIEDLRQRIGILKFEKLK